MLTLRSLSLACVAILSLLTNSGRSDEPKPQDQPAKLPTEAEIMAAKLKHAQFLLDAITHEDFKKVEENATALVRISNGAEFLNARRTEEYAFQSRSFRIAMTRMAEKARARNIDGVMLAYQEMSNNCLRCHQHTRDKKRD
jgi:cytochrome c556